MKDVYIGKGKYKDLYEGRGVYANRDFDIGETVVLYNLKLINHSEYKDLPKTKRDYVHSFWGKMHLFSEPACYVNHSTNPNTKQDLDLMGDVAVKKIKKGEMITTDATLEMGNELQRFVEYYERDKGVMNFKRLRGDYENNKISYSLKDATKKELTLKRVSGNWRIIKEVTRK